MLRSYQRQAIDLLWAWIRANDGNPCIVLPTGAGKSHVNAAMCKEALQEWPETRILMLTHVFELLEQNAEKMREHWPGAPMGIYSAGMRKKQLGEPITFAGIQSIARHADRVGHVDLVIIDECHLVGHEDQGRYRTFLNALWAINPAMRVVGLTATPWRLGHGLITDKPAIFDYLIEPVSIEELLHKGHLAPLRSKLTKMKLDVSAVSVRGGDYVESELQAAVDTSDQNEAAVAEVIKLAGNRKAWLFFCAGIDHAMHVRDALIARGIAAACVTGDTPKAERKQIIADFRSGKLRALTNANVLTTGFDYPDIDLIAMLRPTESPVLYVQMAGRGLRKKSHTDHCLVLDFAGVVETHGPITNVTPPSKKKKVDGAGAPTKKCSYCEEINHASVRACTACGEPFPEAEKPALELRDIDIMGGGLDDVEMQLTGWAWKRHLSATSGKEMFAVTYYGALSDKPVTEYMPVMHEGYAGQKAWEKVSVMIAAVAKAGHALTPGLLGGDDLDEISAEMSSAPCPRAIKYRKDGKFYRVSERVW